jgi:signal transduction histidine kinase/CheY-like chemotaxis protein
MLVIMFLKYFHELLDTKQLSPHGFCLLWRPELLWTHIVSDALIGIAYMTIPLSLAVILRRRKDVPFGPVAWSFVLFIAACGCTHFMAIWTLWHPDYGAEALLKAATAIVSVFTAVLLWTLVPFVVSLPSPASLQQANADLEQMVLERDRALISLRRETEQRAKAEDALRQAQKIEAVGELTGGVAHDFNNLLTVIIGGLDMICRNPGGDPVRVARAADMALQGAQRAAGLTARLLAFARRQPLNPTRLRIDAVVTDLAELLHRTLGEQIELKTAVSQSVWTIEADQNQLESALVNLAVNARDAMPAGGKLTIEIANVALDDRYVETNADAIPGEYVVVAVSDSGEGMSKATSSRVFEPFFTTKPAGKGTGLGLSMVYGFVKQSGGHVTIYSEIGFGTTVKLYFPRSNDDVEVNELISDTDVSPGQPDEVILVVEDNEGVRRFSTEALRDLGYQVLEAADADAALTLLQSPAEIALLFTDVVLPGRSGRELADLAKTVRPDLPILFTSGYARNAIVHHGRLDAGIQLLGKPFTKDQLAARVRGVLNRAHGDGSS